jgi:serine/threonine protein kinase
MEASESVLRAGHWLDRYELLRPIATGGMATVWLAKLRGKRGFEKLFAVKTIRTELAADAQFEEMFLDEARIASSIQHPNVAQILDLGEQEGVLFIVMEWVDGDSLAKIRKLLAKKQTKVPVGMSLRLLADACAGLHAAHELRDEAGEPLGIVHRDVSPHNILVATSGSVKVIDFGIAKAKKRQQGQTRTGIVKGKVQYMAPEQVKKGGIVDRRADVWALGICLHELIAGDLPHGGEDDVGVVRRLMSDEAPLVAANLPQPIARLMERSIAVDPDARFPTAAGMQRAIEGAMKELGESTSSEDVAGLLRAELPDLALQRKEAVGKAIEEARGRVSSQTPSRDDVAFAKTEVGERDPRGASRRSDARALALTKRKGPGSGPKIAVGGFSEDSSVTPSTALEQEPITIPKRSLAWLWVMALLVVGTFGAAAVWPAAAKHVLTVLGVGRSSPAAVGQQIPAFQPSTRPASAESAKVTPAQPAFLVHSAEPSTAASTSAHSHGPIEPAPLHAISNPLLPPGASLMHVHDAAPPVPSIMSPLPAPPPPPPENEEDPNNPYSN